MLNPNEAAVLFSGGTDSTLTAALMADRFQKVHLVTYTRYGFFSVGNTKLNARKLMDKYGKDRYVHHIINIDALTEHVFYERYWHNLSRYGFFVLSICGLCKLAMHMAAVVFCLEHKIANVCDGANQGMYLFPDQMSVILQEYKNMYARFQINYFNPVFDFDSPPDTGFLDRLHFESVQSGMDDTAPGEGAARKTTGCQLFKLGLMPSENVKGSPLDRKMQPRCFQFILFNIFVQWYYLYNHTYDEYVAATQRFYKDKIACLSGLLDDYARLGAESKLFKLTKAR
ncbi:MAG: hypothetical protein WC450_04735 [Candidatus Omnitrophota bacterium]|jgi:hypothetical protein